MIRKTVILLNLAFLLTSCSALAPKPTETPTPTITLTPTETLTPLPTSTNTPLPPTATKDVISSLLPSGTPVKEWKGIPIMPGAINGGEGDENGYSFTIQADPESIYQFYKKELAKLGYTGFATGTSTSDEPVFLIFSKGNNLISILIAVKDDIVLVLIVMS